MLDGQEDDDDEQQKSVLLEDILPLELWQPLAGRKWKLDRSGFINLELPQQPAARTNRIAED